MSASVRRVLALAAEWETDAAQLDEQGQRVAAGIIRRHRRQLLALHGLAPASILEGTSR